MKNFRQICAVTLLFLTLSLPTLAGVMEFPVTTTPPPDSTSGSTQMTAEPYAMSDYSLTDFWLTTLYGMMSVL